MQNPHTVDLCATDGPTIGIQRRRPPDGTVFLEESGVLERPGSPIPSGFRPVQKKGRRVDIPITDEMMVVDEGLQGES
ncbi:hypothetical protein V6N13_029484 [Hibiscus sabdariffa]